MEVGFVGGLRIESDFSLPGLLDGPMSDVALGCIVIRRVSGEEWVRRARKEPDAIALEPGEPGSFLVTAGNEVLVAPAAGAAVRSILSYLFGPCLGVIAYRNSALPLHASAIGIQGGCVGFVGHSGAGKSTAVAALSQRGHPIHADDVCMLRNTADGELLAWPGIRWIRLTEQSVRALDYAPTAPRLAGRKHTLELQPALFSAAPRILRAVYVLEEAKAGEATNVVRLRGARAAERIIANVYRPKLAQHVGAWPAVVACCVAIADRVPVFIFRRPLDFSQLTQSLDVLEAHMAAIAGIEEAV